MVVISYLLTVAVYAGGASRLVSPAHEPKLNRITNDEPLTVCPHLHKPHCCRQLNFYSMQIDMSFLEDGVSGDWSISTFEVPKSDLSQKISIFKTGRGVPAGIYKRLKRKNTVVMSNTPDEINDFSHFTRIAKGSVLINGLGIGCVIKVLLDNPEITKITVIEKSEDVIKLVSPYFNDERLIIINADAFSYLPPKGEKYDYVWHDIWDYITSDNLPEMAKLHRKYGRRTMWQDSWAKPQCQRQARNDRRYAY